METRIPTSLQGNSLRMRSKCQLRAHFAQQRALIEAPDPTIPTLNNVLTRQPVQPRSRELLPLAGLGARVRARLPHAPAAASARGRDGPLGLFLFLRRGLGLFGLGLFGLGLFGLLGGAALLQRSLQRAHQVNDLAARLFRRRSY